MALKTNEACPAPTSKHLTPDRIYNTMKTITNRMSTTSSCSLWEISTYRKRKY